MSVSTNRVYIDCSEFCGKVMRLQLTNDMINPGAVFDNVLGIYWERADQSIIPNSALVIYPKTRGLDPYPDEYIEVIVPVDAQYMGYWIASDAGEQNNRNGKMKFERFDVIDIRKDGASTQGFTTKQYDYVHIPWLGRDSDGNNILGEPVDRVREPGYMIRCHGMANVFKMSNPIHNHDNFEWFMFEEDGSVLIEDLAYNTGWDFGIWWTKPRSLCDFSLHPGCEHE